MAINFKISDLIFSERSNTYFIRMFRDCLIVITLQDLQLYFKDFE